MVEVIDFEERGYKKYKKSPFQNESIIYNYQKRFTDEVDTKYFINIHVWGGGSSPISENCNQIWYEYTCQLYSAENRDAVDLTFHTSWNIDEVEEYVEKLFSSGMFQYYEREDEY